MRLRRWLSIPALLVVTALLTAAAPLLAVVAIIAAINPNWRGAFHSLVFILGYVWCETVGLVCLTYVWLTKRNRPTYLDANRRIQRNWAASLTSIGRWCYSLDFQITGDADAVGDGPILLPRHTSLADTIIPIVFYASPLGLHTRYVMKQELLWDPCLDIAGNRIPNVFIDRSGQDSARAVGQIQGLVETLDDDEILAMFPEGTRFSEEKRLQLANSSKAVAEQAKRRRNVLPPRMAGTSALLKANPGRDCLFVCHTGFEGSSHFSNLINGGWRNSTVRIHFWRVPFTKIPTDDAGIEAFIDAQWDRMEEMVIELDSSEA